MRSTAGRALGVSVLLFVTAAMVPPAAAQTSYRLRIAEEVTAEQPRRDGARIGPRNLFAAAGDAAWTWRDRLRLAGGFGLLAGAADVDVREREAYVRASAASWLDAEAGRRVVKWGTGYAFTPTGVLDPPRDARDPLDRLSQNRGILMAKADMYRGATAVSVVVAAPGTPGNEDPRLSSSTSRLYALRARSIVRGVEMALVGAVGPDRLPAWGANFTHVIGERFEWHGEWMTQESRLARGRRVSGLIGVQYTPPVGPNLVVEYYRDGDAGRDALFVRASGAAANPRLAPDIIALVGLNDGSVTLVPALTWNANDHVAAYGRATWLYGPAGSLAARAPSALSITCGVGLRF